MLRSDKAATYIMIGAALLLIIGSLIALIVSLTGEADEPPQYERRAAPALVRMPDDSIVGIENASRPPISDRTYEILHTTSRMLGTELIEGNYTKALVDGGVIASVRKRERKNIQVVRDYVRTIKNRKTRPIAISVLRPVNGKTRSTVTATYVGASASGSAVAPVAITFDIFWEIRNDRWRIIDLQTNGAGGESTDSTGSEGIDGDQTQTTPADDDGTFDGDAEVTGGDSTDGSTTEDPLADLVGGG